MTKKQLYKMGFTGAITELQNERENILSYDILKDFAVAQIENDNIFLAIHVLTVMQNEPADYYNYDCSMGTIDTPAPINTIEDLADFCD